MYISDANSEGSRPKRAVRTIKYKTKKQEKGKKKKK